MATLRGQHEAWICNRDSCRRSHRCTIRSAFCPQRSSIPGIPFASRAAVWDHVRLQGTHTTSSADCGESRHSARLYQDQSFYCRRIDRRAALALLFASLEPLRRCNTALASDVESTLPFILEPYVDEKEGFTLLKPSQWSKIEKAGATVLFEDPQLKGNNVGVVVNPVRISSLSEFGTVDVVANKLLQAEKKKSSTNDVQLIKVNEKQAHGGAPLYQLEYKLDSSRGVKRILSAVTVASKKLYILNVAYADTSDRPLQPDAVSFLEKIVNSFDVL